MSVLISGRISKPMSSTGAELVSDPDESCPRPCGHSWRVSSVTPRRSRAGARRPPDGIVHEAHTLRREFGRHVVEQDRVGPGTDRFRHLLRSLAFDMDRAARPEIARPRHARGDAHAGEVVVLSMTQSLRLPRGCVPGGREQRPSSSARSPGVVLRVFPHPRRGLPPALRSTTTSARTRVATPDR